MNFKWALNGEKQIIEDAWKVRRTVFIEEQGINPQRELDGQDESSYHIVGYQDDKPVACSRLQVKEDSLVIQRVAVLASHRGQNLGVKLMQEIEAWASQEGFIKKLSLSSQDSAIPFYEKLGFEAESDFYEDAGIPHRKMVKKIR